MGCSHPRYVSVAGEAEAKLLLPESCSRELFPDHGGVRRVPHPVFPCPDVVCAVLSPGVSYIELSIPATTEKAFFSLHFLPFLEVARKGIKTLLKMKLLQVLSEPQ